MSTSIKFISPHIHELTSENLEHYVAAIFQANGYYVKTDLWWSESLVADTSRSVDILQADVLAYNFSPFGENFVLTECKGGGTFGDFFKFSGIIDFLNPSAAFFICNNSPVFDELVRLGNEKKIKVFRPNDVIDTFSTSIPKEKINLWYWSDCLQSYLLTRDKLAKAVGLRSFSDDEKAAFAEIKKYNSVISGRLWRVLDPRDQANQLTSHFNSNKGFIRKIQKIQKVSLLDPENAISEYILCESAATVILKAKVEYITIGVRCAISSLISTDKDYLTHVMDDTFRSVIQKLIDDIQIACRLPQFLQFWIYQFGGLLNENNSEITEISKRLNERDETTLTYFKLLNDVFSILIGSGTISWGLHKRGEILEFNGVPDSIRGFGIIYREYQSIDTSSFLYKKQWIDRLKSFF